MRSGRQAMPLTDKASGLLIGRITRQGLFAVLHPGVGRSHRTLKGTAGSAESRLPLSGTQYY